MEKKKLTPMEMVAREMAEHSALSQAEIEASVKSTLNLLRKRAADAIVRDEYSCETKAIVHEYQAVSEMVNFFGSQLIAFEDLDVQDADRPKN